LYAYSTQADRHTAKVSGTMTPRKTLRIEQHFRPVQVRLLHVLHAEAKHKPASLQHTLLVEPVHVVVTPSIYPQHDASAVHTPRAPKAVLVLQHLSKPGWVHWQLAAHCVDDNPHVSVLARHIPVSLQHLLLVPVHAAAATPALLTPQQAAVGVHTPVVAVESILQQTLPVPQVSAVHGVKAVAASCIGIIATNATRPKTIPEYMLIR